jgi:hypothetical protein
MHGDSSDTTDFEFLSASGPSIEDCVLLGYRTEFEQPFSPSALESWGIYFSPNKMGEGTFENRFMLGTSDWLTELWRSPAGHTYVSNANGLVKTCTDLSQRSPETWQSTDVDAQLMGIWGVSDAAVYTWGKAGPEDRLFRFDGKTWTRMPSPGNVSVLHGLSPDLLYAVGYDGLLARWDGRAWTRLQVPAKSHFTGLFVAGPDEVYATTEKGELWEGTSHGWAKRAGGFDTLLDVAKFKGEVWVAGGDDGLLRLKSTTNELECIKPNIHAKSFDTRGNLLITTKDFVAQTADGVKFQSRGREVFQQVRGAFPPLWLEP